MENQKQYYNVIFLDGKTLRITDNFYEMLAKLMERGDSFKTFIYDNECYVIKDIDYFELLKQ